MDRVQAGEAAGVAMREVFAQLAPRFGRRLAAGAILFREGEPADCAFLVQSGRIRLVKRVRQIERRLSVASAGELIGESAVVDASPRAQTAAALTDSAVLALDRPAFRRIIQEFPALAAELCEQLVVRLRALEEQMEIMTLGDAQSKVVSALLRLARGHEGRVVLELSPVELASRVGLDVDTVKRAVQRLREQQYLRIVSEKVELLDVDALGGLYTLLGAKDALAP